MAPTFFVVIREGCEGADCLGVFTTQEQADARIALEVKNGMAEVGDCSISEHILDK